MNLFDRHCHHLARIKENILNLVEKFSKSKLKSAKHKNVHLITIIIPKIIIDSDLETPIIWYGGRHLEDYNSVILFNVLCGH